MRITSTQRSKTMLTERSTPIPEKITDAGENTCEIGDELEEKHVDLTALTSPIPAPIVAENE